MTCHAETYLAPRHRRQTPLPPLFRQRSHPFPATSPHYLARPHQRSQFQAPLGTRTPPPRATGWFIYYAADDGRNCHHPPLGARLDRRRSHRSLPLPGQARNRRYLVHRRHPPARRRRAEVSSSGPAGRARDKGPQNLYIAPPARPALPRRSAGPAHPARSTLGAARRRGDLRGSGGPAARAPRLASSIRPALRGRFTPASVYSSTTAATTSTRRPGQRSALSSSAQRTPGAWDIAACSAPARRTA